MSLSTFLKRFFSRDRKSTAQLMFAAIGPRAKVGSICVISNTGSMEPTFKGGEKYRIVEKPFNTLKEGTLVVFYDQKRGINIIHRIIRGPVVPLSGEVYFLTKGDANSVRDTSPLTKADYIGIPDFEYAIRPVVV